MRLIVAFAAVAACQAGCLCREGNLDNVGAAPHEWVLPGPDSERKVFGPLALEEVRGFVREKESEGWEIVGFEPVSLPEEIMVDAGELDQPSSGKRGAWTFDIPKSMKGGFDPPPKKKAGLGSPESIDSIPPYLDEGVRAHRQKYLVILRRWL